MALDIGRLKTERKRRKMTQQMLADRLNVSRGTVAMWEIGKNTPPADMLVRISELFNCSVDYLLGKTDVRVDDSMLDEVNTLPPELLESCGNVLDAKRALYADSTPDERELLMIYRDLNDLGQTALLSTARGLVQNQDMKKDSESNAGTTA